MDDKDWVRLRANLGGVSTAAMKGDNLSILLASAFSDPDDPEDECGWGETAMREYATALDAIHEHYRPLADTIAALRLQCRDHETAVDALRAENAKLREALEIAAAPLDTFAIGRVGTNDHDIVVNGSCRFAHERDVVPRLIAARAALEGGRHD